MVETSTNAPRDIRDLGADVLAPLIERELKALIQELDSARERQWEASPVPRPREDAGRTATSGVSDPTADVVMDTRRLKLSHEIGTADRLLAGIYERLTLKRVSLDRATRRFEGCDL